uniref:Pancreatic trypsin inhibitor n=1 Tax=Rhipicephalus zambeziensis TaxID=60191 RepID=A0A224YCR0_9ACAR
MNAHVLLVIAMALIHAGGNPTPKDRKHKAKGYGCSTPIMEYEPYCGTLISKYYYNRTARRCQHFRWNGCLRNGVYDTRIDCANHCSPDEDASICEKSRPSECTESSDSKGYVKTQYFYNITSQSCETYNICSGVGEFLTANSFNSKTLCILQCGGFTLNHTKSGRSDGRQLLGMLDTEENIWIYKISYNNSLFGPIHTCAKYKKFTLTKSTHMGLYPYDYDYSFFYEWVINQRTYQTRYSGHVGYYNETSPEYVVYYTDDGSVMKKLVHWSHKNKCGIVKASRRKHEWCELHVWEDRLRMSLELKGNHTDCQEELTKHCPNSTEQEVIPRSCPNVFFRRAVKLNQTL